jgi:hypothetical protein
MGLSVVPACSSDKNDGPGQEESVGTLALALQATAASGNVYILRNAFFQIVNVRTGETVEFLSSDSGMPEDTELRALLSTGDYTVTLQPGWFLERVGGGGPGGFGGTFGTGGKAAGGFAGFPDEPAEGGFGGELPPIVGGEGGSTNSGGSSSTAGTSVGGSFPIGGSGGGGEIVQAQLLSQAVQFFSIFQQSDSFVHYQFRVGGEIVDFTKGTLHITIGVEEDASVCTVPDGALRAERMLLETNLDAVSNVSLFGVLEALTTNGGRNDDPIALYQQIWDSFATADQASVPDAVHCGDETTNGQPSLNGYPISCNRVESFQVDNLSAFFPTAFVNRMDLAPANGAHCGQQRMIFANNALFRAFMIVEAQIPNPAPELGIEGCRPLAEFWLQQNQISDGFERGNRLAQAFLVGDPTLAEFGFGPFYTAENLTVGSGQIRTNTFDQDPWTLREFKLALDGDALRAIPFPVAESPHGALWNEGSELPAGEACRQNFIAAALDGLMTDDLSQMSFVVDGICKNSESRNDFSEDYAGQMSDGFRAQLEETLAGTGLSAFDIANRARFAGSCIGCHQEASNSFLGNGVFAPFSVDFPQVTEFPQQCGGGESGLCFPTSPALQTIFLPGRMNVLAALLGIPNIPNPCGPGGGGGGGGSGGASTGGGGPIPMGGSFGTGGGASGGAFSMGGSPGEPPVIIPEDPEPAPVIEIELPSASESIEILEEADAEIREQYGDVTLSGRSAQVTH